MDDSEYVLKGIVGLLIGFYDVIRSLLELVLIYVIIRWFRRH